MARHQAYCAILNGAPEVCTCGLLVDFAAEQRRRSMETDEADELREAAAGAPDGLAGPESVD